MKFLIKASEYLLKHDKNLVKNTFTFAIIYQKYGQVSILNMRLLSFHLIMTFVGNRKGNFR
jgi:hypothetical protein